MPTSAKFEQLSLIPFCTREGPWKYLNEVNSMMKKGRPKTLAVGNEFVFSSDDFSTGFLVEPSSHLVWQNRRGEWDLKNFRKHWQEKSTRTHELVMRPKGGWCYMGRYKGSSPVTLEPEDFLALPKKTRKAIYRLTGAGGGTAGKPPNDVPSMYATGEIKAVKIEFRQVGFNDDIYQALFNAADRRAEVFDS